MKVHKDKYSEMYKKGYCNSAISFDYIPDFKDIKEKQQFTLGLKDGYRDREKNN